MTDTTVADGGQNNSPLHQPARDNSGNLTPPPAAHVRAGLVADSVYDGLSPDQQSKYARMPRAGDLGGADWIERSQIAADPAKPGDGAAGEKHKFGDMEFTEQELRDLLTAKGEADLRKATLPATPADYKAELPANFEMPGGAQFEFKEADPLLQDARAWAHSKGLSQSDFAELCGMYASAKGSDAALVQRAGAAEVAKLGVNGTARVTALETWLRGTVGDKLAGPMRSMMVTAGIVQGLETIMQKMVSGGAASFSQAGRVPGQASNKPSEEQWGRMSPAERMDYTNSTDQSQFRTAR
jgi:hypothetical protein